MNSKIAIRSIAWALPVVIAAAVLAAPPRPAEVPASATADETVAPPATPTGRSVYTMPRFSLDAAGGGSSGGGIYSLTGTAGQAESSPPPLTGGTFRLTGGFWPVGGAAPVVPGDANGDGQVNLDDYPAYESCFGGPEVPQGGSCDVLDFNQDGDVDLADFVGFQEAFQP